MQKTAYEMLISDWSSDVCSSVLQAGADHRRIDADRLAGGIGGGSVLAVVHAGQAGDLFEVDSFDALARAVVDQHTALHVDAAGHGALAGDADDVLLVGGFQRLVEIGRAHV